MVEIFATNIERIKDAVIVKEMINNSYPDFEVNFDLNDIDNVLRVKSITDPIDCHSIVNYVKGLGFLIYVLE